MTNISPLNVLADLLQSAQAHPVLKLDRFAPSAFYDLHYRMFIIASSFEIHANPYLIGMRRINASRLKLLQFVAFRPWLLPVIRTWSASQGHSQLAVFSTEQLRRGFLGDKMHDDVVDFLVARNIFVRMDTHVVTGVNAEILQQLYSVGVEQELFSEARHVLKELVDVRITNRMLEGW